MRGQPPFLFAAALLLTTNIAIAMETQHTNALIHEKSPYLLQHAQNPVNWYAWGEEAFAKAKKEDKPIFLSIGYSTCHWCHVMEEESFEDQETAKLLNESFVSIKVDREERPDIDQIYMNYVIATTGHGGWPMSVFLTPDRKPFYGGTYFPKESRHGLPSFTKILDYLSGVWKEKREEIEKAGESFVEHFEKNFQTTEQAELPKGLLTQSYRYYLSSYDKQFGGFGRAPKFPSGHTLSLLMRHYANEKDAEILQMVEATLRHMANGGLRDHVGGGFHRYSVDAKWFLPHFEKMLYDQAMLSKAYVEAFLLTGNNEYAFVTRNTLDYVLHEMKSPEGGFYSAQDADSPDPNNPTQKREGAFYVWTSDELKQVLNEKEYKTFSQYYGVLELGNVEHDPHQEFVNQNVLHVKEWDESTEKALEDARKKIYQARLKRPEPHLDDKILTDWNGLMIASFARASMILNEEKYKEAAIDGASFVLNHLWDEQQGLMHRYREGESGIHGQLDDYTFFIYALCRLYEATFNEEWLNHALQLQERMNQEFWDKDFHAFFMTSSKNPNHFLITRPKDFQDGAMPSGNSIAAMNLAWLGKLTQNQDWISMSEKLLLSYQPSLQTSPTSYAQGLMAYDFIHNPSMEIVIAGEEADSLTQEMIQVVRSQFLPRAVTLLHRPGKGGQSIEKITSFIKNQNQINGKSTAYVCQNYTCKAPTNDIDQFRKLLSTSHLTND